MNRLIIPALLAASVLLSARPVPAQPAKGAPTPAKGAPTPAKGAPTPGGGASASAYEGRVVVVSELKPGDAVRVKWQNEWTDGTVVEVVSDSQVRVQIGGNRESFMAEKVWGTQEARDNEAAGGYLDPTTRENFELFKVAVDKLEAAQRSGDAEALKDAREAAESILERDYGKAGQHPRVGPTLVRYWAIATRKCDELAAAIVANAEKAVATNDYNYFADGTVGMLSRAEQVEQDFLSCMAGERIADGEL